MYLKVSASVWLCNIVKSPFWLHFGVITQKKIDGNYKLTYCEVKQHQDHLVYTFGALQDSSETCYEVCVIVDITKDPRCWFLSVLLQIKCPVENLKDKKIPSSRISIISDCKTMPLKQAYRYIEKGKASSSSVFSASCQHDHHQTEQTCSTCGSAVTANEGISEHPSLDLIS